LINFTKKRTVAFNRYLYELLLDNEVVIIPDFGAFITSVVPSRTDALSGNLLPPAKAIRFDPKIRNNDFLFINYYADKEGITENEALWRVRKICDEILYRLDNGEQIEFENTGVLYFDVNKELCFEPGQDAVPHLDSYGLAPVTMKLNAEKQEKEDIQGSVSAFDKKRPVYLWFFLVIPLATVSFFVYRMLDKPASTAGKLPVPQEETINDNLPAIDTITKKPDFQLIEKSNDFTQQEKKYFVIGGSFENEENARNYISKMERKGFKPFVVEKKGRFYIVALDVFTTLKEAGDFKQTLENETKDTSIWILPD